MNDDLNTDGLLNRVELFNTVRGTRELKQGCFYWVRTVSGSERGEFYPATEWQPARYTGLAGDSVGETWDFIGHDRAIGHHYIDVMQVGAEIVHYAA